MVIEIDNDSETRLNGRDHICDSDIDIWVLAVLLSMTAYVFGSLCAIKTLPVKLKS